MNVGATPGLMWRDHSKGFGFKKKKNHPKRNEKCAHIGRGVKEGPSLEGHFENATGAAE